MAYYIANIVLNEQKYFVSKMLTAFITRDEKCHISVEKRAEL